MALGAPATTVSVAVCMAISATVAAAAPVPDVISVEAAFTPPLRALVIERPVVPVSVTVVVVPKIPARTNPANWLVRRLAGPSRSPVNRSGSDRDGAHGACTGHRPAR